MSPYARASCDMCWRQNAHAMPFVNQTMTFFWPRYSSSETSRPCAEGSLKPGAGCPTVGPLMGMPRAVRKCWSFGFAAIFHRTARAQKVSSDLRAQRVPLVGAEAAKHLAHAQVRSRLGHGAGPAQVAERRFAGCNRGDQQRAGHDRQAIAQFPDAAERKDRGLPALDDVEQAIPLDEPGNRGDFVGGCGRFDERDVGAGFERGVDARDRVLDRKSTRLNSSHSQISYAVFCLKKKKNR